MSADPDPPDSRQPRLFRTIWRWHFYAGLLVIPVLVVLCLSGIVYLFKPQIDTVLYGDLRSVEPTGQMLSYDEQLVLARTSVPGGSIDAVGPPPEAGRATEFGATTAAGREVTVYVDPYEGEVLGQRDEANTLTRIALDLHGTLLASRFMDEDGKWGDRLIELTASWAVVLVITGLYLWWPRGPDRSIRSAFRLRWRGREGRGRWKDLHATTGVLFAFVMLFFLATGLAWSGVWGERYSDIATRLDSTYPPGTFDGVPSRKVEDVVKGGKPAWAAGELPVPPSDRSPAGVAQQGKLQWNPADGAPLDAVIGRAQRMGFPPGYRVTFPADETSSYAITLSPDVDPAPNQSALDERFAFIDQYTAQPVGDFRYGEFGLMAQASDLGIALHEGRQFGLVNQLMTLLATLALLVSMASAVVMWRKRRPRGIGAPRRLPNRRLSLGVVVITLGLGVFFPLLGYSIVAFVLFDFLVVRRVRPLARALGAA